MLIYKCIYTCLIYMSGLEKLQHIPGNLEGPTHDQYCVHAQERPEKALTSHIWLILRLCALCKQKVKSNAQI